MMSARGGDGNLSVTVLRSFPLPCHFEGREGGVEREGEGRADLARVNARGFICSLIVRMTKHYYGITLSLICTR